MAQARPMPCDAPVTSAILPVSPVLPVAGTVPSFVSCSLNGTSLYCFHH
jgi:hypothetical protein